MKPVYKYRPPFRGGSASREIIRHQLRGKRAAPPKSCPRTDADDSVSRQGSAVNEHEIMNNRGRAIKSPTSGFFVRDHTIHQCGDKIVGELTKGDTFCDKVVMCLRGSGRGGQPTRAGFGRSQSRGRSLGRQGGEQAPASESEAQSEPHEAAHNTAAGNGLPALGADAEAANRGSSPHNTPLRLPLPLTLPEPHPSRDARSYRSSDRSLDRALLDRLDVGTPPLQPVRPNSNLPIGPTSVPPSKPDSDLLSGVDQSQESSGYVDRETGVNRLNWLDVFPFNYIQHLELPDNEWDFWSEQQEQAPNGIPSDDHAGLVESHRYGNPFGLSPDSSWAFLEWMVRTAETRRQRRQQIAEAIALRRGIESWIDSTEASRAETVQADQAMNDGGNGDQDHDADQSDGAK